VKIKKSQNRFDSLVDRLIQEFIKIPNFNLLQEDEAGNKVFNIVIFRIAEVSSYKDLVCQHFIPATNKAIFDSRKDFMSSKYKTFVRVKDIDFQETLNETIRLAYVGLFHKLENFINDVIKISDLIFGDLFETDGNASKWAKDKFQFDFKDWQQFHITHKINWICNCVKHKDGFPIKEPKPLGFEHIDETQRIKIKPEEFKKDCELLIEFYPIYLKSIFMFAQHKLITEKPLMKDEWKHSPELYEKQVENLEKYETILKNYVVLLKKM